MKTYPAFIPPKDSPLLLRKISDGERRIFNEFLKLNGYDEWFVCHSLMLPGDKYKSMYEMDFVIVGPPGLFVIEVKGKVLYDSDKSLWDYGYSVSSTSPFKQASDARYSLLKKLKENFKFDFDIENEINHGIGVIFTANYFDLKSAEWDREYILDVHNMSASDSYLDRFIKRTTDYWSRKRGRRYLTADEIKQFRIALRPEVELAKMLRYSVEIVDENFTALTREQYRALDLMPFNERMIFNGAAGTGKTFLAIEAARRLAVQNKKVLFLCFNPLLSAYLNHNVKFPNVTIISVHEFFYDLISDKKNFKRIPAKDVFSDDKYLKELPSEFLKQVSLSKEDQYDVLLIDEAQDLLSYEYLLALDAVIKDGWQNGEWYLFLDSKNQINISGYFDPNALAELDKYRRAYYELTENCRNTLEVIMQTKLFTGLDFAGRALHNLSGETEIIWHDSPATEYKLLKNLIERLKSRYNSGDITLLTSKPFGSKVLHKNISNDFEIEILSRESSVKFPFNKITVCDPVDFKGLENRIVCVIDINKKSDLDKYLIYVSFTRARYGLYIFINEPLKTELEFIQTHNLQSIREFL
jgi:hypothetical protein